MSPGMLLALLITPVAQAQDPGDFELDDDIEFDDAPAPAPAPTSDAPIPEEPDDGDEEDDDLEEFLDLDPDEGEEIDLLGEEDQPPEMGGDTEQVYRDAAARLARLGGDEELAGWEEYLASYPLTVFRKRIESRMEVLMDELYSGRIDNGTEGPVDAMRQEIDFAHPMQLENINPRTRIQVGFEWGLPNYMNLIADYEHQFVRTLSAHAGVRRRYQGWNVELGPRWALVKSSRTNTLVTLIGDFHFNTIPSYPGFRPQLAAGTRIGKFDAQAQGGVDLELRSFPNPDTLQTEGALQARIVGGASLYFAASDRVGLFGEAAIHMKPQAADGAFDGGLFAFNVITFGMKFYPGSAKDPSLRNQEVNMGATVPFMQQYYQFHYGSIMGQFNYYL